MNKPFDAMRATPAEAISYFSLEETLGCVVHGIEYVWSAVRLVDRRETPGREVEVREALAEWHQTSDFISLVQIWGRREEGFEQLPIPGGDIIGRLEHLTEESPTGSATPYWSLAENSLLRAQENSAKLLALIGRLKRQLEVERQEYSLRLMMRDAGYEFIQAPSQTRLLESALNRKGFDFQYLNQLFDGLTA